MRKTYLKSFAVAFAIGSLFLSSCSKEESSSTPANTPVVPTDPEPSLTQQATVFYFGGTWFGPCGAVGKPAKEALKKQIGVSKVSVISCQVGNDPMKNSDADALYTMFKVSGVPAMFVGGADAPFTGVPSTSKMSADALATANTVLTKTPTVNILASFSVNSDGLLWVDSKIKFFKDVTDKYYAVAYLTEDSIVAAQTSDASVEKNVHYSILRTKMGMSITGDIISDSTITKNQVFKRTFGAVLQPTYKKAKLNAVVVVWKKNADGTFVVSNSVVAPIKQ